MWIQPLWVKGRITDDMKTVINMVRKDVLRTDRHHPAFAGEVNQCFGSV